MAAANSTYDLSRWKAPFFTIWTGQAFSLVGSRIAMFALIWWLTDTTGSATVLALATLFAMLPMIVLGPVAGVFVDRWNRKRVMIVADGIIALLSLGLAFLFWTGQIQVWHVYVVMLARELGGIFHWPAMQSSTSLMVPEEHLARVSGINQALNGGVNIVGPAIGALLLAVTSIANVMLLDVTTALLAIVPLFFVFIPQPPAAEASAERGTASLWADLRAGARYLFGWRGLMVLTGVAMLFKIALTPAFSLLPILVTQHFGGAAPELAAVESLSGIGLIVGGLLLGVWGGFKRRILTTMLGVSVIGLALLIVGLLPGNLLSVALALMFVLGAAIALTDGPLFAVLQSTVAPEMQGRVFMLFGSVITLTSPIGLIIAGPVTDAVGVQVWFIAAGIGCLLAGIAGFFIPSVVHVEEDGKALAAQLNGTPQPTAVPDVAPAPGITGD
jgi:DHA3 family macrolide efflux protein-like MFS transporter